MPRAGDPYLHDGGLPLSHDPLNRINFQPPDTSLDIGELLDMWRQWFFDVGLPMLEELTGIDLTILEPLLGGIGSPEDFINMILNPTGLLASVPAIVEAITGLAGGDLPFLGSFFGDLLGLLGNPSGLGSGDLDGILGSLGDIPIFGGFVAQFVEAVTGLAGGDFLDLQSWAGALLGGDSPLNASNLFNLGNLLGVIPISQLGNESENLVDNPDFREAVSLAGAGIFTYDSVDGKTVPGCAVTNAASVLRLLRSNAIKVAQDDKLELGVSTKWSGLSYTGTKPVKLQIIELLYNPVTQMFVEGATVDVAGPTSPGATQATWLDLFSDQYVVPAGVSHVCLQPCVNSTATAGQVKFDDGIVRKNGLIQIPWVDGLPDQLQDLLQFGQDILNHVFGGIFGALPDGDVGLMDVFDGLLNIPPGNVQGLQGGTIVDTFTGTIDTLWGGFAQLFGTGGKSVFDVASLASDTVGTANTSLEVSEWNNAILGFRAGESLFSGLSKTEVSNFASDRLTNQGAADPVTLNAAAGFTPMAFYRAKQSDLRGVIHWHGKGFANVTSLFIDLYRFNYTTNQLTWFHTSPNQVGIVGSGWGSLKYVMAEADRFQLNAGDVIAVGWRVVGTGTHSIAGIQFGAWMGNDTTAIPSRHAAIRTDSAATTVSFASLLSWYSNNIPWLGLDIVTGDVVPDYHAPRTTQFAAAGAYSYPIPDWADEVDEILCSGAGGGQGGDPAIFQTGGGGRKGNWSTRTLVRGTDFPAGAVTLTGTVGDGGAYGNWPGQDGENGGATTRNAISGGGAAHTVAGGNSGRDFDSDKNGQANPNITYGGITYPGGGQASHGKPGANGQAPGGGGGGGDGGTWGVAWRGGNGARGTAIYVARQVD